MNNNNNNNNNNLSSSIDVRKNNDNNIDTAVAAVLELQDLLSLKNNQNEIETDLLNKIIDKDPKLRNKAARIIQTAYRQYKLKKNYFKICENNTKRRSLDIEKLNCLSPPTPAIILETQAENPNHFETSIENILLTSSSLVSLNQKNNSIDTISENKTDLAISSSSLSSASLSINSNTTKQTLSISPTSDSISLEADNILKEQLDLVLQSNESTVGPTEQIFFSATQSNSCSSVHSVYSTSTVSSKCSYLSSGSSISSNKPMITNVEMIKISPLITSPPLSTFTNTLSDKMTPRIVRSTNGGQLSTYERKLMVGATLFNDTPKHGIKYLFEIGDYISDDRDTFSRLILE